MKQSFLRQTTTIFRICMYFSKINIKNVCMLYFHWHKTYEIISKI